MMAAAAAPFVRDRFTWLAYLMLAYATYGITVLSSFMPLLGDELGMSYSVRGLHVTAFALGGIFAGLLADRLIRLLSRPRIFWLSGAGLAASMVLIGLAATPVLTVAVTFIMGLMGVLLLVVTQAVLADHTGRHSSIAISESSIGASVAGLMGPLLISLLATTVFGWRAALILASVLWVVMLVAARRIPVPDSPQRDTHQRASPRLPRLYWIFWGLMIIGTAVEWSVSFWTPEYFKEVIGMERAAATGTLTFFWLAFIAGRTGGSILTRRFSPTTLLVAAAALMLVTFPVLLIAHDPLVAHAALFVMTLGIANFFPMTLASAMHAGRDNANAASARIALGNGLAILIAPQVLGSLGDQIGIEPAYGLIGILGAGVLAYSFAARRIEQREDQRSARSTPIG